MTLQQTQVTRKERDMSTLIRPELSKRNKFYIPKSRYYELKYHCLQYKDWKKSRAELERMLGPAAATMKVARGSAKANPVLQMALIFMYYDTMIKELEQCCKDAEPELADYILKGVTEGLSYESLRAKYEIPCGKDMYYDRYRKFFYILDNKRRESY